MINLTAENILFGSADAAQAYADKIERLIWSGGLESAEAILLADLAHLAHPIADICMATPLAQLGWDTRAGGWDTINTRIAESENRTRPFTALGIDLSAHGETPRTAQGWREPSIEVNFYADASFPFSTATQADLTDAIAQSSPPWQGCFEDIDQPLQTVGLAQLHSAVDALLCARVQAEKPVSVENDSVVLGSIFLSLRFHQLVRKHVETVGLIQKMPVIVGSHDMEPYFQASYLARKMDIAARPRRIAAAPSAPPVSASDLERRMLREGISAVSGSKLRQRISQNAGEGAGENQRGLLGKLFGR